ncbi:MAG: hypothetical protein ACLQU5_34565 [Isosphaeraceae bacterium]
MSKICYVPKRFNRSSTIIINQVNQIIEQYRLQGFDLTLRQFFYQFVSRNYIANKDSEYKRLGSIVSDARHAGLIDWDAIVDRTRYLRQNTHWDDPADIIESCASSFAVDKWSDQEYRPEVWVEKDALVGILEAACEPLDVPYFACRGYASASEMVAIQRKRRTFRPAMECCEDRFLMSTFAAKFTTAAPAPAVWKPVSAPGEPGNVLPSYYAGGQVEGIVAKGSGAEFATWTVSGLTSGYYSLSFYYDANPGNAAGVFVSYQKSSNTSFVSLPTRLNETTGTPDVVGEKSIDGFLPVHTLVTPYKTSNAASYIWVPANSLLAIRISDSGDTSGLMIADTIMLTLISTTK